IKIIQVPRGYKRIAIYIKIIFIAAPYGHLWVCLLILITAFLIVCATEVHTHCCGITKVCLEKLCLVFRYYFIQHGLALFFSTLLFLSAIAAELYATRFPEPDIKGIRSHGRETL